MRRGGEVCDVSMPAWPPMVSGGVRLTRAVRMLLLCVNGGYAFGVAAEGKEDKGVNRKANFFLCAPCEGQRAK